MQHMQSREGYASVPKACSRYACVAGSQGIIGTRRTKRLRTVRYMGVFMIGDSECATANGSSVKHIGFAILSEEAASHSSGNVDIFNVDCDRPRFDDMLLDAPDPVRAVRYARRMLRRRFRQCRVMKRVVLLSIWDALQSHFISASAPMASPRYGPKVQNSIFPTRPAWRFSPPVVSAWASIASVLVMDWIFARYYAFSISVARKRITKELGNQEWVWCTERQRSATRWQARSPCLSNRGSTVYPCLIGRRRCMTPFTAAHKVFAFQCDLIRAAFRIED